MNTDLEDALLQLPLKLEEIIEKCKLPVVIYRDNWIGGMKFFLTKAVVDKEKLRAFGYFIYDGERRSGFSELFCTYCKYRVEKEAEK